MPTVSEPLTDIRNQKHTYYRDLFVAGVIGEHTYAASLQILRMSPPDIRAEVGLALMDKQNGLLVRAAQKRVT